MLNSFMEKYVNEFEDTEENKLIYTDIFKEYVSTVNNQNKEYFQTLYFNNYIYYPTYRKYRVSKTGNE